MATRRGSKTSRARSSKRASKKRRSRGRGRVAVRAAWRDDLNEQLQGHRSDALALLLGVLGVIAALGIYSDLAGPFGRAIDDGAAAVLGGGRFLVPIALVVGALALIVPVSAGDDEDEDEEVERAGRGWRLGIGLALTLLAAVGLMHICHGNFHRSLDELERAGGAVGALVGAPLRAGLGPAGAVIVLVAVGALGVLLMVGLGLRQVGHGLTLGARFVGHHAGALLTMQSTDPEPDDETVDLFVMTHIGHPWHLETVALLQKHANAFLMTSGWAPKHVPAEIIHLMNTRGQHKVMWSAKFNILPYIMENPSAM